MGRRSATLASVGPKDACEGGFGPWLKYSYATGATSFSIRAMKKIVLLLEMYAFDAGVDHWLNNFCGLELTCIKQCDEPFEQVLQPSRIGLVSGVSRVS